jgi:hypothetical protein
MDFVYNQKQLIEFLVVPSGRERFGERNTRAEHDSFVEWQSVLVRVAESTRIKSVNTDAALSWNPAGSLRDP